MILFLIIRANRKSHTMFDVRRCYYYKIDWCARRWQSTRRRHSVPGGGRIVFAGDLYVNGWQLYKQGQTTAPLPSAGEPTRRRRNTDEKITMCNVRIQHNNNNDNDNNDNVDALYASALHILNYYNILIGSE